MLALKGLAQKAKLNPKQIHNIFATFQKHNERPLIELDYTTPYTLLVAVILSAQATDVGVNKATPHLFQAADTPEKMVTLGEKNLKNYIKSIGLYNSKAAHIIAMSQMLIDHFQSIVPNTLEDLQKLPGVGRKSANVILNSIFREPTIGVDTHVFRISNRIGLCSTSTTLATEKRLIEVIPAQFKLYAHHWLVLHGRYICKARTPLCGQCIIREYCTYEKKI